MIAECYDIDGQNVTTGQFSLITKSLYRAQIDVEKITGFQVLQMANNWCLMGDGNKRILISKE